MQNLHKASLEVCFKDTPCLTTGEIDQLLVKLPGWQIVYQNEQPQLYREFEFANFTEALAFTNAIGELAEQCNHHPSLTTEWGKVTVIWWTHLISGLHINDFLMAAKCDQNYDER